MSKSPDIVERLRFRAATEDSDFGIFAEAANEIELLNGANRYTANALGRAEAEIERLRAEIIHLNAEIKRQKQKTIERLFD
jgi:hypothetical protein